MSKLQNVEFVFTSHGTVLYVSDEGELRHGRLSPCRSRNACLVQNGSEGHLLHSIEGKKFPITCGPERCWSTASTGTGQGDSRDVLRVIPGDGGGFGLAQHDLHLSALPDGSMRLAAPHLRAWETFERRVVELRDKPRVAGITMVFNESVFLPIWERHYAQQLGYENLFLIDHGSTDGSTQQSRIPNRITLPRDDLDENHRTRFVSGMQGSLLQYYDAVLFTDVDEYVVADPERYRGIVDYCTGRFDRFVTTTGFDVLHYPELEGDLDLSRPILEQRKYVRFSAEYCKPLLAEIPLDWVAGFHACQHPARLDNGLFLFHLKLMDRNLALEQLRKSKQLSWTSNALRQGHWFQHRLDADDFMAFYYPALSTEQGRRLDTFAFEIEMKSFNTVTPYLHQKFRGGPRVLAERFRQTILGSAAQA